jgi:dTDP-4-dehydrorhamnose 3,5-epimerase-like enzyme
LQESIQQIEVHHPTVPGDARGWVVDPLACAGLPAGGAHNIHVVSLEPAQVRGNHYHLRQTEWLLFLAGPLTLALADPAGEPRRMIPITRFPALVRLPPGVAHAVRNEGRRRAFILCFSDREVPDPAADKVRIELLPAPAPPG